MTYSPFRILAVVLLIAVNGYFAGAEVALLSVRHSRLRQMAEAGEIQAPASITAAAGDATRMPFPDGSFDLVIAAEVLEHIPAAIVMNQRNP